MASQAYHCSARDAKVTISTAIKEAVALLPDAVVRYHWIVSHHSPAAWWSVAHWYLARPEYDPWVSEILTDLALMFEALACLTTVTTEQPPSITGLKLARTRRLQ